MTEPRADAPRLRVEDLTKVFRSGPGGNETTVAVQGVSLSVAPGETYGLVGASGSGKTTFARLVLRLLRPTSGGIWIDGTDVSSLSLRQLRPVRRRAQMIAQDPFDTFHPGMRVADLVAEPLVIHREGNASERRARAAGTLEDVGLAPASAYLDRFASELSGGQRQRVAIARAIVLEPTLLVADEPTSMLDASVQLEILLVLRELRDRRGLTTVLITHDLAAARFSCDRVSVMRSGKIVEEGPVHQVLAAPQHPYTQALVDAAT